MSFSWVVLIREKRILLEQDCSEGHQHLWTLPTSKNDDPEHVAKSIYQKIGLYPSRLKKIARLECGGELIDLFLSGDPTGL